VVAVVKTRDYRVATEDAMRRLAGEDVPEDPEAIRKMIAFSYAEGAPLEAPPTLLCATCGSKALTVKGSAHAKGAAAVVFLSCAKCGPFGIEFALLEGVVAVRVYEPEAEPGGRI